MRGQPGDPVYRVHGIVLDSHGKPVQHVFVQAFDRDLRKLQPLGTVVETEANGGFRIDYQLADFQLCDSPLRRAPWLIVEVREKPEGNVLASQEQPRAEPIQYIELELPSVAAALSEWEQIAQIVAPLLIGQGSSGADLQPWELEDADIDFIVRDTQIDREQLRLWVTAARMSREVVLLTPGNGIGADNEEWILFYGWFRDGQPQDFSALLRLGNGTLLSSLERALKQRYIPGVMDDKTRTYLQSAIDARQISEALKPAPEDQPASFGDAFKTIHQFELLKLDDPQGLGAKVVSLLIKETSSLEQQWQQIDELVNDSALFNGIRRSVGLMQLTDGYVPLIQALQLSEVDETAAALVDLVKHDTNYWISLAEQWGTPSVINAESDDARFTIYGRQIAQKIELMHPAPFVHHLYFPVKFR